MDNNLGDIISKLRKEKNYTQKDLADKICVSDKSISRYETGKSQPDLETIYLISKEFGVSFNDLLKVRVSNNNKDSNLVKEIINEFSEINKKHSKVLKIILAVTLAIIVILSATMILTSSYNRFKVYDVYLENSDIYYAQGVYVETRIKDSMVLSNIKLRNREIKDDDIVSIDLYYKENGKEYILQNYSSLDNIYYSNFESYIKIEDLSNYSDNLYIRIKIIDKNNKEEEYVSKVSFVLDFSNNKIFYNENVEINNSYNINLTSDEIKDILLKNDYKETSENILYKETADYNIHYFVDINKVNYVYKDKMYNYDLNYNLLNKILEVSIFNSKNIEVENYKYNISTDKVDCITGKCNGYKEAMQLIEKNFLKLLEK